MAKRGYADDTMMEQDAQVEEEEEPSLRDIFRYVKRTDSNVTILKRSIDRVEKTAQEAKGMAERANSTAELALREVRDMQREMQRERSERGKSDAASTGVSSNPYGSAAQARERVRNYVPTWWEIKGFATWSSGRPVDDSCVSDQEAFDFLTLLEQKIDVNKRHFFNFQDSKERAQRSPLSAKIILLATDDCATSELMWAQRRLLLEIFTKEASLALKGKAPRVSLPPHEDRKPYSRAGAIFIGAYTDHGKDSSDLKLAWHNTPLKVTLLAREGRPRPMTFAFWSESKGWEILPDALAAALGPDITVESFTAALR